MSAQDYSFWSRALHRLALGNRFVAEMSFDIERLLHSVDASGTAGQRHVFIAGLARAGTTVLMRELYATGAFRSLTYRDMPFLLAPNTWGRVSRASRVEKNASERAHGDGVLVDFDSPEALEEVFWRVHCGPEYIRDDRLAPMAGSPETDADFADYVALLLHGSGAERYLSKNNNNILRLDTLARVFPNATIIIPFREPAAQAGSLMHQHRHFLSRHAQDGFARDYMTWLVHHEFGADHRPFVFEEGQLAALGGYDSVQDPGYWLRLWTNAYRHTLASAPTGSVFLSYERLCDATDVVWPALCDRLGLPPGAVPTTLRRSRRDSGGAAGPELQEAEEVYASLRERAASRDT